MCIAAIREKLKYSNIPAPLRGIGISFIVTGLMSISFMSFMGIDLSKLKGDDKKTETTQSVPATTDENTTTIAEADLEIEEKADNLNSK